MVLGVAILLLVKIVMLVVVMRMSVLFSLKCSLVSYPSSSLELLDAVFAGRSLLVRLRSSVGSGSLRVQNGYFRCNHGD